MTGWFQSHMSISWLAFPFCLLVSWHAAKNSPVSLRRGSFWDVPHLGFSLECPVGLGYSELLVLQADYLER